jgi:phosphonopyruvate decarboxylase
MINSNDLLSLFLKNNINFFTGVPDSVLSNFTNLLQYKKNHIVAVNEGSAVSIAIGNYLSTGRIPLVYLQNSGLGNAINPLSSISDKNVYNIPVILLVGWRGSPEIKDEPQHSRMGSITTQLLTLLGIEYLILEKYSDLKKLARKLEISKKYKKSLAILIKNKTLTSSDNLNHYSKKIKKEIKLSQHEILGLILPLIKKYSIFSTTGYISREILSISKQYKLDLRCFYNVGGMGHVSSLTLGFLREKFKSKSICIDGDGSFLMHLGSLHTIGRVSNKKFKHLLFNNFSHLSVGGQKTYIENINIKTLVKSLGYNNYFKISSHRNFKKIFSKFLFTKGPSLLEIQCGTKVAKNLPRIKNFQNIYKKFVK